MTLYIENPNTVDTSFTAGSVMMMLVICTIFLLWIAGMVVAYTNVGNKSPGLDEEKVEHKKSKWALLLYSFNPFSNLNKILTVKTNGDKTLEVLNGVRVFSMCWVIIGHAFFFSLVVPFTNVQTISSVISPFKTGIIAGGTYAVDVFFWLSGFLTFYIITTKLYAKKEISGIGGFIMLYVHRYIRLVIPLAFVQFFMMTLLAYFGDGPLYW